MPTWSEEQLRTHLITADALRPLCPPRAATSARPWRAQVGDAEPPRGARVGGSQLNEPTSPTFLYLDYPQIQYVGT